MPFSEDHELFRESLRRFVQEEILPHVEEWEEKEETPRSLFEHMGELGFLGAEYPPEYGGGGADFWMSVVLAEELARCRSGGVAFGVIVHTDMSSPWLVHFGTGAQKRRYLHGHHSGPQDLRPGHHRAGHRFGHGSPLHPGGPRRQRLGPDREPRPSSPTA